MIKLTIKDEILEPRKDFQVEDGKEYTIFLKDIKDKAAANGKERMFFLEYTVDTPDSDKVVTRVATEDTLKFTLTILRRNMMKNLEASRATNGIADKLIPLLEQSNRTQSMLNLIASLLSEKNAEVARPFITETVELENNQTSKNGEVYNQVRIKFGKK